MPSSKVILAILILVLGGGGATAGAAMGGAFTPSKLQEESNTLPDSNKVENNESGSSLDKVDSVSTLNRPDERRVDTNVDERLNPLSPVSPSVGDTTSTTDDTARERTSEETTTINTTTDTRESSPDGTEDELTQIETPLEVYERTAKWPYDIEWVSLSDSSSYSKYRDNTLGKNKGKYFVAPYGKNNEEDGNKAWWDAAYAFLKDDHNDGPPKLKLSKEFDEGGVTSAYAKNTDKSPDSKKALNRVCDKSLRNFEVHLKLRSNFELLKDIWNYCSFIGFKPGTVEEDSNSSYEGKIGEIKKDKLLSVKDNDEAWKLKQDEFFDTTSVDTSDAYFHKFKTDQADKKTTPNLLKNECEKVYNLVSASSSSATTPTADEVEKYCSL